MARRAIKSTLSDIRAGRKGDKAAGNRAAADMQAYKRSIQANRGEKRLAKAGQKAPTIRQAMRAGKRGGGG